MDIITRAEWGAEPPQGPLTPWDTMLGIVVHWAGGYVWEGISEESGKALMRAFQKGAFNDPDLVDIPYNFCFDGSGRLYEGRGWDYRSGANGSTYYNSNHIAICYLAGRTNNASKITPFTDAAKATLTWFCQETARRRLLVAKVRPHSEVRPGGTECPGDEVRAFLPTIELRPEEDDLPYTSDQLQTIVVAGVTKWAESEDGQATLRRAAANAIRNQIASTNDAGEPDTELSKVRSRIVTITQGVKDLLARP